MADNIAITAGAGTNVGTDERSIGGNTVHVQRVTTSGSTAYTNAQVSIAASATTLLAANDARRSVTFLNMGANRVYIGAATVTTANGFPLDSGAAISLTITTAIQGISSTGTNIVAYISETD